jgi:hypothetical protein
MLTLSIALNEDDLESFLLTSFFFVLFEFAFI